MTRYTPCDPSSADHQAIVQLTHDYCWALDTGDGQALRQVFAPDAVAHLTEPYQGIEAIIERVTSALGILDDSQHMVSTHQVVVEGDQAWCRCYLQAQHVRRGVEGGPNFIVAGRYEDRCERRPEGWRIVERRLIPMWTEGNPKVTRP